MKLLLAGIGVALVGSASAVQISFDEAGPAVSFFSSANPLGNEYAGLGIFFSGPSSLDGGAIINQSGNFGVNALSGTNFLAFNRSFSGVTMLNGGRPIDPETITFNFSMNDFSIYASAGVFNGVFVLSAFDASNNLIGMDVKSTGVGQWQQLKVGTVTDIARVTLTEVSGAQYFVYDDLSAVPEPATMAILGLGAAALIRRRKNK